MLPARALRLAKDVSVDNVAEKHLLFRSADERRPFPDSLNVSFVSQVAIIMNPDSTMHVGTRRAIETAAPSIGVQLNLATVRNAAEIESAIDAQARKPNGGLIVLSYTKLTLGSIGVVYGDYLNM
jgi:hypothetical protein